MEAATPLRHRHVRVAGERLLIDGLVVDDPSAVRLVRERAQDGEDAALVVAGAVEIGARVLDREQAAANAEFVRTEMERAARELNDQFVERARSLSEQLDRQLEQVFGEESGHLAKALRRHFSDESSGAVQHRVREVVSEVMVKSREDLSRQFSTDDGRNPLAGFQRGTFAILKQSADQQDRNLRALLEKIASLELELHGLRDEREKKAELAAVEERGTAKGRTYEELVHDALDRIASAQGDDCQAVGDLKGATGKTGDVVVDIDACAGPAKGRIVFEAKNRRLSRRGALSELDEARTDRDADFAVLVVPAEDKLPAGMLPLREHNGDKMIVTHDPEEDSGLALQLAYSLARARVLMAGRDNEGVDTGAVDDAVQRAIDAMGEVRKVKSQLTGATTSIEGARGLLEGMEHAVRDQLEQVRELLAAQPPAA